MFWLRSLFFAAPLVLIAGGAWLFEQVSRLRLADETPALVTAIQESVGFLNPILPQAEVTREVTDLLFEPLLVRDDDLNLRPNLISGWTEQTVVVIRCSSEEAAGESEAKIRSGEYLENGLEAIALERVESVLTVALRGFEPGLDRRLLDNFDPENLGDYLLVRLKLRNSVRESFETFLRGAVEKGQIKMLDYEGDTSVDLFLKGDTDLLLRELELYYGANRSLDPEIEVVGDRCHTTSRQMTIDLREDVRWHDGKAFTARDVVFSYNMLTGPVSPYPLGDSFWFVERLNPLGDFRLLVNCRDTPVVMMESWEKLPVLPAHLLAGTTFDDPAWAAFFERPVGVGPYRFARRRADGGIELAANEQYFRSPPLEKYLVYRKFGSLEATLLALRSERVVSLVPDERFTDWTERNPGVVRQVKCLPRFQHFVAWNLDRSPLDQREVRVALAHAIDRNLLLRDTSTEFQQVATGLFFPGLPCCDSGLHQPVYNPRAAERMLEDAGFRLGDGAAVRLGPDGKALELTLTVNEANREHLRLAEALASQWGGVGVSVRVEAMSWPELLAERLSAREFDGLLLSWELPFERDRFTTWHSSEAGGGNLSGLRNPLVDECVEKLRYESDPAKVKALATELQAAIADLQPCLFLCESGRILSLLKDEIVVVRPGGQGERAVQPVGIGKSGLERVRPWWVRKTAAQEAGLTVP